MPKIEIDYSNTIIYKITCNDNNVKELYVGHTTNFIQKKYAHKKNSMNYKSKNYNCKLYEVIRNNGGWNNWKMEIVNCFNCKDHHEAMKIEQEYVILLNATLNTIETLQTPKKTIFVEKAKEIVLCDDEKIFYCNICNYSTNRKSSYNKHITTIKHHNTVKNDKDNINNNINIIEENSNEENIKVNEVCEVCEVSELCEINKENKEKNKNQENKEENILMVLLKQNQEFKDLIIEQNKKIIELASNNNVTNNITTNHNKFNLNIFLNEKCKDAPNFIDFINSVELKITDFENFGTLGYADNISRILLREIKGVDIYKRPIHCSDLKREIIHVKDDNSWKKDDNKQHMKKAIKQIAYKNFKFIMPEWIKANPDSKDISTKKHDQYIKMMSNFMGEVTDEGDEKNYNKIIRNVVKEILVDKDK